ncbi:uncharacterized protein LOC119164468 isoform X1 [Rhipicephalus microplus]|uniref:uncharacterized protein LOC119164468 isoform X1 n=1 Tax=Rhipicephalus microplus TaxID=6941 RepID=UPI003F6C2252
MDETKYIDRGGKEDDDYETTIMARLLRDSSKECQANLLSTCTQETQTQEVDEESGALLPRMPDRRESGTVTGMEFYCASCGGRFVTAKRLRAHVKVSHKNRCSLCSYTADTKFQAERRCGHQPFESQSHARAAVLERHEKRHRDNRVVCIICGRRFSSQENLEVHKKVHTSAKLYECDVCGQCFNVLSNMKRHRNLHSGTAGQHTCPDCGRAFHQKSHLRSHIRTHTGERPFQCSQCNERFTEIGSVRKHERMMHEGVYPHYCPYCNKGLANGYKLRMHADACYRRQLKEDATQTT